MFTLIIKRCAILLMAFISLFTANQGSKWADYSYDHDFEIIEAMPQCPKDTRIMSFNLRCIDVNGVQVKDRLDILVRQIKEIMPDSLGMQEATPEMMKRFRIMLPEYAIVGVERENGGSIFKSGESCPVMFLRTKYCLLDYGNFWLSDTPDVPSFGEGAACKRICTWVKLREKLTGKVFVHVNTHYDHVSEEARVFGANQVMNFIEQNFASLPLFFTADMNTTEGTDTYDIMTEKLIDSRYAAEESVGGLTFHGTNPETHRESVIDFILCTGDVDVRAYRVVTKGIDGRFSSDHFPLYADVRIPCR